MAQWNVLDVVYLQEFSVAVKEITAEGVQFKPDGTKMYTVGRDGVTVDEYNLVTQWDVSSAVYLQEFSVVAKETSPRGIYFKPDGTKMYVVGDTGKSIDEYDLGTQWDVSAAVYLREKWVGVKEAQPRGVWFKPDGTKMYIACRDGNSVDEYDLGVQWDVSTAGYLQEKWVGGKEMSIQGVYLKPDGTKMYTMGSLDDAVDEYDLDTQWDVLTAVYLQEISVAAKEIDPSNIVFKPDGTKMYTVGYDGDTVDEYDLL